MKRAEFKNLKGLIKVFNNERACRDHFEAIRWQSSINCPHCGSDKYYTFASKKTDKNNKYKCASKNCRKKFNCLTGTVFEHTKLSLMDWFKVIYIFTSHKKGISSVQLAKDLGLTQKTAWFVLHRIREMLRSKTSIMFAGDVEADETYIGGREKNKHKIKQVEGTQGRSMKTKRAVLGLLERGGSVFVQPIPDVSSKTIQPIIDSNVKEGSNLYTDEWRGYSRAHKKFTHEIVRHRIGEYVINASHTNGIENFWSLLKRGIYGIYHSASKKHLSRYCDEFAFRFNTRKCDEQERFNLALSIGDVRLPYNRLVRVETK